MIRCYNCAYRKTCDDKMDDEKDSIQYCINYREAWEIAFKGKVYINERF